MIVQESFGGELSSDVFSDTGEWLYHFTFIWNFAGRRFSWLIKKLGEVIQLDDIMFNWKLVGSRSIQIITSSRYKTSEVVQLPSLLTMWCHLAGKSRKRYLASRILKSGQNKFLMRWGEFFVDGQCAVWKEKVLYRKTLVSCFVYSWLYHCRLFLTLFTKWKEGKWERVTVECSSSCVLRGGLNMR